LWLQIAIAASITFAVVMFGILLWRGRSQLKAEGREYEMRVTPYVRRPVLLSPAEQVLFARLNQACGPAYIVCPKVRLPDAVEVRGDAMEWQGAWNRIAAKHLDFLLVASGSFVPLLAVELEDAGDRQRVDELLERALVAAGLPVLRIRARGDYDPISLRQQMDAKLRTL
jgi:hypothetical protein